MMNFSKNFSPLSVSYQASNKQAQQKYLTQNGQAANAGNLKEVKNRIKSVTSIRKITKTMNMIATARLKQAQARMEKARVFYGTVSKVAETLQPPAEVKKSMIIAFGSDRGLCGAINSSIARNIKGLIKEKEAKGQQLLISGIGEKVPPQLGREYGSKILTTFTETSKKNLNFLGASLITDRLLQSEVEAATLVFNKFNTVISYTTTQQEIGTDINNQPAIIDEFEFEEDEHIHHYADVIEHVTAATIFRSCLEGTAAELGGRMSSMDNATRNAGDMIKRLTIMFNRKRQAAITTELTEIISGASAIQD